MFSAGSQFGAPRPEGRGLLMILILSGVSIIRAIKAAVFAPSKDKHNCLYITARGLTVLLSCMIVFTAAVNVYAGQPVIGGYTNLAPSGQQNNPKLLIRPELALNFNIKIAYSRERKDRVFLAYLNGRSYTSIRNREQYEKEDKAATRREWREFLGFDVFMPYFKVKEAEEWVSEKASVHVYKMKGKPKFDENQIHYIFKTAF